MNWLSAVRERGFPRGTSGKEPTANVGDLKKVGSTPGSGRSLGVGNSSLL